MDSIIVEYGKRISESDLIENIIYLQFDLVFSDNLGEKYLNTLDNSELFKLRDKFRSQLNNQAVL